MSFSTEQKTQIITQLHKNQCCRRALLYGILFPKAVAQGTKISFSLDNNEVSDFASKLIAEFFSNQPVVSSSHTGGRGKHISFNSSAYAKYLVSLNNQEEYFVKKCQYCSAAFFKGIFLSVGRVSDPTKQYSLELVPKERISLLKSILSDNGIELNYTERRKETLLYSKNSTTIEDFFAIAGMNTTAFCLMNEKIENEIRNTVNRVRNCETNNIDKAVSSALRHINAIEELEKSNLISMLPEELQKTARLRLDNRDLSLQQLALVSPFSITKSGLSHRLNRIIKMAEELTGKKF